MNIEFHFYLIRFDCDEMIETISDKLSRLLGDYRSDDDENDGTDNDAAKKRDNTKTDTSEYQFCLMIPVQYHEQYPTFPPLPHT